MYQTIIYEKQDQIGTLIFNRPQALNALNSEMLNEMSSLLKELSESKDLRCLIITGQGEKSFIAGADIKEMHSFDEKKAHEFSNLGHSILLQFRNLPFPVISAVNGFALGGGTEMAIAGDFIIASENAVFGLPEVSLGLIPGFGGTQRLAQFVGVSRASEMIFTGKKYSAQECLSFGLVSEVVPLSALKERAQKVAMQICKMGPLAVGAAKKALVEGLHLSLDEALKIERKRFSMLFSTSDQKEGTLAFIEKRQAQFLGK